MTVTVTVKNVNERPVYESLTYQKDISELLLKDSPVLTVVATDPDHKKEELKHSLVSGGDGKFIVTEVIIKQNKNIDSVIYTRDFKDVLNIWCSIGKGLLFQNV